MQLYVIFFVKQVNLFRENTRILEINLGRINKSDCCCSGISDSQCFILAEILNLDKSGISRTVEELVQKQLVERKASAEDRRYVVLNLTDKGNERFSKIEDDMNARFKSILDKIPREKRKQVIEALELYNTALEMDR